MDEEFELIPVSPIKKLEKRISKMESSGTAKESIKELIDIVRANQHVIDDIVKINSGMINKVSELINTVDTLTKKTSEFINRIEVSAGEGGSGEKTDHTSELQNKIDQRLEKLERRLNALILSGVKTRMRRRPLIK